jgi:hypothetical protein
MRENQFCDALIRIIAMKTLHPIQEKEQRRSTLSRWIL